MYIALPTWNGRISPVLDVARRLVRVRVEGRRVVGQEEWISAETSSALQAQEFVAWGVGVVICGAVSAGLRSQLEAQGIRVLPHRCGAVAEVLQAFLANRLDAPCYAIPGCRCRRRGGCQQPCGCTTARRVRPIRNKPSSDRSGARSSLGTLKEQS